MLEAIKNELQLRKDELKGEPIETIYFGGGTPSLLSITELDSIFNVINEHYIVKKEAEITLEANPDDLSILKIKELSKLPINRLSIGVQSFFEDDLKFMNRAHTAKESSEAIKQSLRYFENITIDLIYGIPKMTLDKWKANLQQAFDIGVPHISAYALTVEKKTALHRFIKKGTIPPLDEQQALEHFEFLVEQTRKHGFVHYEISNFGKPDYFSKHNKSYWFGEKYLGFGPSAHSYNGTQRSWNIANNVRYINEISNNRLPIQIENLSKKDRFNEYVMTGLRTVWGISYQKIKEDFGSDFLLVLEKNARPWLQKGFLEIQTDAYANHCLQITAKGKFLADGIASDLFQL